MSPALMRTMFRGEMRTIPEISRETGVSGSVFYKWLRKGMNAEEIVQQCQSRGAKTFPYRGQMLTAAELARIGGIHKSTLMYRLNTGWSVEDAVHTPKGAKSSRVPPPRRTPAPSADTPEGMRWNAAEAICKTIACNPAAFGFRCAVPMTEYAFESDLIGYRIRFLSPELARLTAYWKDKDVKSDLYRVFRVDGEKIKEVRQE